MNPFILAFIGVIAFLVVGFFMYGTFFADATDSKNHKSDTTRMVLAAIGMYIAAYEFIVLYDAVTFSTVTTNLVKGLYLGALVGIPLLAIPLLIDGLYIGTNKKAYQAIIANWAISFIVLGLVVGLLR